MNKNQQRNAVSQSSTLPQALAGNGWVSTWKRPRISGEVDYITGYAPVFQKGNLTVWKTAMEAVNPRGLGALRIYKSDIQTTAQFDPDAFQQFIADAICVGSAAYLDRRIFAQLIEAVPTREAVSEIADRLELKLSVLDNLYSSSWLYHSNYLRKVDYLSKLILPANRFNHYGKLWIPQSQAEQFIQAEGEEDSPLRESHVYCDVLATKHALLTELGLTTVIAMDSTRITAWKAYQEAQQ